MQKEMIPVMLAFGVTMLSFLVLMIAANWKVYGKAGKPGWGAIVPIYNVVLLLEIVNRPSWWILLLFVPVANFVVTIMLLVDLAKSFGKSVSFALGLIFLPFIFFPMLGFGSAEYQVSVQQN